MRLTSVSLGALTSKVSAYKYRSWELENKEVLDIFDSLGVIGNISIKGLTVVRILPTSNDLFDWISDKFRFSYDSFLENRALRIFFKKEEVSLFEGLQVVSDFISSSSNANFFLSKTLDIIDSFTVKNFSNTWFGNFSYVFDSFTSLSNFKLDERIFTYINFVELTSYKTLVLWGVDLRIEFPLLEVFFLKKLKFEEIYTLGNFEIGGFNLGNNLIKHWSFFFNGHSLLVKNILRKSSFFLGGSGIFWRIKGCVNENFIKHFFEKISHIFNKKIVKYFTILPFMSDINVFEAGLTNKTIGGVVKMSDLVFAADVSDIYFVEKYHYSISFSRYFNQKDLNFFDLVFPIKSEVESNLITYNIRGILNFCEKVITTKNNILSLSRYFNLFESILKCKFVFGGMLTLIFKSTLNRGRFFFLVLAKTNITLFNLFIFKKSFMNINKLYLCFSDLTLILQATISNYYYTHKILNYSPTILLADARLFRKSSIFN